MFRDLAACGARLVLIAVMLSMFTCERADGCGGCFSKETQPVSDEMPSFDLFAAIERGMVEARIIARDQFHARLLLTNVSQFPLAIQLPDVLAARPVLAQQGLNFFGGGLQGGGNQNPPAASTTQSVGGSPVMTFGQQMGGRPGGNGVFSIPPEKVRTVEIACLCLEQGKPNPRSSVKYELVPLAAVNDDPRLATVLKANARGDVDRDVAQAAAWNIASKLSWERLAGLSQMIAINAEAPIFNSLQLRRAKELVDRAGSAASRPVRETASDVAKSASKIEAKQASERPAIKFQTTKEQAVRRRRG